MKQFSKPYLTAFTTLLLAGHLSFALPATSGNSLTSMVSREEGPLVPGLYGESGKPESADLLDVIRHISSAGDKPVQSMSFPLKEYASMLWAFTKSDADWVKSWFPTKEELDRLKVLKPLSDGETYVLRHDDKGDKRHGAVVSRDWYKGEEEKKTNIELAPDVSSDDKVGWWPWALLEAGYGEFKESTMGLIVKALSGESLKQLNSSEPKDLWDIIKHGESTPIWLRYKDTWHVVMTAEGETVEEAKISLGSIDAEKYEKTENIKVVEAVEDINEVFYLEGRPTWAGKRNGDIDVTWVAWK